MVSNLNNLDNYLSGHFSIEVEYEEVSEGNFEELSILLGHLVKALGLGMFPPAKLRRVFQGENKMGLQVVKFEADDVAVEVFGVLAGMLEYFEQVFSPLKQYLVRVDQKIIDIPKLPPNFSIPQQILPFEVNMEPFSDVAPELLVIIEFVNPPSEQEKSQLLSDLKVWNSLLQGGYPVEGDLLGVSGTGSCSSRFVDHKTIHHYFEAWRASLSCFHPLYNMCLIWHIQTPISRIDIQ